jgi:hypothetical protein
MKKEEWKNHWHGMPEFNQPKSEPFSMIRVRFETKADLQEFAELIGQKLTPKTQSIWHPKLKKSHAQKMRWQNET